MQIILSDKAKADFAFFKKSGNNAVIKRIGRLVKSIAANPFEGIGKPEPLRYDLACKWSRRVTQDDRIIYEVSESKIIIHSLRGHYEK